MEAKTTSHDLMEDVDSLPSDISELIARNGRCKQSFVRVNLDCGCIKTNLVYQPSYYTEIIFFVGGAGV